MENNDVEHDSQESIVNSAKDKLVAARKRLDDSRVLSIIDDAVRKISDSERYGTYPDEEELKWVAANTDPLYRERGANTGLRWGKKSHRTVPVVGKYFETWFTFTANAPSESDNLILNFSKWSDKNVEFEDKTFPDAKTVFEVSLKPAEWANIERIRLSMLEGFKRCGKGIKLNVQPSSL